MNPTATSGLRFKLSKPCSQETISELPAHAATQGSLSMSWWTSSPSWRDAIVCICQDSRSICKRLDAFYASCGSYSRRMEIFPHYAGGVSPSSLHKSLPLWSAQTPEEVHNFDKMTISLSFASANVRTFYRGQDGVPGKLHYVRE